MKTFKQILTEAKETFKKGDKVSLIPFLKGKFQPKKIMYGIVTDPSFKNSPPGSPLQVKWDDNTYGYFKSDGTDGSEVSLKKEKT